MGFDPGYFDEDACRVEPIENPFKKSVTYVSGRTIVIVTLIYADSGYSPV